MRQDLRWFDALHQLQHEGEPLVLLTVLSTAGSTPRDAATKMVVTASEQWDTLGGGHLEYKAIEEARRLLALGEPHTGVRSFELGANLGQCCGGATQILFEVFASRLQSLTVFGAGHVAHRLMPILRALDLQLTWVDSRTDWLPTEGDATLTIERLDQPTDAIADLPEGAWVLILTHNHQLDFDLVQTALRRPDIDYIGLIGSDTKARRFRQRLAHRGWSEADIARVVCPVGLADVPGKQPAEVAISIAGQIVQRLHAQDRPTAKKTSGLDWKTARNLV
ncbi:xanthine dehydrogenase accessory protein XdhC [Saccharospirillum salsuginis]|uniref:Xanthine dehydrogenase accessory protein XdhC n=1 Tax=Saccharospirillum salsuginis TaxID=418750 RepID=A0A918K2V3_9GAMM|nr:xanthine dehydrogenase accessory protein XdhC [Saccharospirillum salsuginis]GGX45990.1 xanthine dehydrogenase accessory protein XdhC [Saccharospirillum salsuginis]